MHLLQALPLQLKRCLMKNPNEKSILRKIPNKKLDSKAVYEAAIEGDKIAKDVFKFTGQILG